MADGVPFRIEQLAPSGGRTVDLFGWDAPHGRPRQGAVLRAVVEQRASRTRYPGSKRVTRHVFGPDFPDIELKGRFRRSQVQQKTETMQALVVEGLPVRISWGKMLVAEGFLRSFDPGFEGASKDGATEVEWTLKIEVDDYPHLTKNDSLIPRAHPPRDYTNAIIAAMLAIGADLKVPTYLGNPLDLITDALDKVTGFVSELASLTDGLTDFKNAAFATLNRIRGAAQNVIRAGLELRKVMESIGPEATAIGDRFNELEGMTKTPSVQEQIRQMTKEARNLDEAADKAIVGKIKTTYVAKDGDTWESISSAFYGSPSRANDIRAANLAGPGEQVKPGVEYLIPV